MTFDDFGSLPLAEAYVPELLIRAPYEVTLKTLRQQPATDDRTVAEEGQLRFVGVELVVLNGQTTPWLQIVSLKSHLTSPRLRDWEVKAASGQIFHRGLTMRHFEIVIEAGNIELLAERFDYQITKLTPARIKKPGSSSA
jgi:hypothetical protein